MDINTQIAALPLDQQPAGLYEPIVYALASGGKRLRPMLALMAGQLYDADETALMPAALALEMFHNFTLLHDDVMDQAPTRRGRQTVWKKWNANTAILSGDQMLIESYKLLEHLPVRLQPEVFRIFSKMGTEICEGQQMDMDFEHRDDVSVVEYKEMIRKKTSVLLGAAMQIGGLLAGATPDDQDRLYAVGVNMGMAFQVQDDLLDVWGDPATFGKRIGGDIVENKKTLALLLALRYADDEQQVSLREWLQKDGDEEEKIAAVRALYDEIGVRQMLVNTIDEYTHLALRELEALPVEEEKKQPLVAMINQLMNRQN